MNSKINQFEDNDEDNIHPLDENDIVEIVEDQDPTELDDLDEEDDNENSDDVIDIDNTGHESERVPERDDAQLVFSEHLEGVLTCGFHPKTNNIVASGGMDDSAFIWDAKSGNKLFTCKGHEDSVEIVSFSYDGNYLATADLNGVIKIWKTRDYALIITLELGDELSWIEWHKGVNILVAASQTGLVFMYRIPSGDTKMVVAPFGQDCLCGKILPDGKQLACGYKDGSLKISDMKECTVINDVKSYVDIGGITCLDVHKNNNLIICGSASGAIILVNSKNGKVVSVLQGVQNLDGASYIEAVSFDKNSYQIAASGSLDGTLIIWDIVKQALRHKFNYSSCINHLTWHPSLPVIFTCHFEGVIRAFDGISGKIVKEYLGHQKSCLNMTLSSDGSLVMTASEDKTVRIFSVGTL